MDYDRDNYYQAEDGSIRRKIPKVKLSKAEKKRNTRRKHELNREKG